MPLYRAPEFNHPEKSVKKFAYTEKIIALRNYFTDNTGVKFELIICQ